jgi:CheY-like chemotaxis protein
LGQGIAPSLLPHVFERFRQGDDTAARAQRGLGLGLAIVRHPTEAHGGTVSADSQGVGQGATFVVRLPTCAVNARQEHESLSVHVDYPAVLSGARILVVDDEADARELLTAVLEPCGADVTTVASAGEALYALERDAFDVLLADIGMPEEDGYSLIRAIRCLPADRGGRIPAVAVTAYASVRERDHALKAGYNWHLAKPVETDQLVAIVGGAINRSQTT